MHTHASVTRRQQVFGYTEEELRILLAPMANTGAEPIGSMGTDTPIAALSEKPRLLFDYFTQLFAQVTNPPLDAIREELVTSLTGTIGPERNLLEPTPASCRQVVLPFPVIDNDELAKIRHINRDGDMPGFITHVSRGLYDVEGGGAAMAARIDEICAEVVARRSPTAPASSCSPTATPPPSRRRSRRCCSPVRSTTTWCARRPAPRSACSSRPATCARSTTWRCWSATARPRSTRTWPWSRSRTWPARAHYVKADPEAAVKNLIKALGKGVLKVMSKMGVSTVASYTGAQIFEAVGLAQSVVDKYFTGTVSKLGGIELDVIAEEVARRHAAAYPTNGIAPAHRELEIGGEYQWRREGEPHLFDPETVFRLQHATRSGRYDIFKQYTAAAWTSSPSG